MHNHFSIVAFGENERSIGINTHEHNSSSTAQQALDTRERERKRGSQCVLHSHLYWTTLNGWHLSTVQPTEWESPHEIEMQWMVKERRNDWLTMPNTVVLLLFLASSVFPPKTNDETKRTHFVNWKIYTRRCSIHKCERARAVILLCMRSFTHESNEWIYSCSRRSALH